MNVLGQLAILLLLLLPACGCENAPPNEATPPGDDPIDNASTDVANVTLRVTDEHGFNATIAALEGHVVLVDFWASWCLPCLAGFPHTVELYEQFHDRGLTVVSVSFDEADDHPAALAFLKKNRAVFTNLRSTHGFNSEVPFATEGALPVLRVYDGEGNIVAAFASGDPDQPPFTPDDVRQAVEQALESLASAP